MADTAKKEAKGEFTKLKSFVTDFGVVNYSVYTRNKDGQKSLVRKAITERGAISMFIPFDELTEIVPMISK